MKKVSIFVGLKIVEIGGIIGIYYILCLGFELISKLSDTGDYIPFWAGGFMLLHLLIVATLLCIVLFFGGRALIRKNWEWADKINNK